MDTAAEFTRQQHSSWDEAYPRWKRLLRTSDSKLRNMEVYKLERKRCK
ncbi:hypothetical protein E2C01_076133 [Portunus trituberculatus]|uniref:Uncharacterized protein n=1 Tax=Portunus trituberculatus TaxID=210409 RepID=A0A5B7ICE9_PORTR|nr:hypothetical protein [Portunus trituberculatus]